MNTIVELSYNQYGYPPRAPKFASITKDASGPYRWILKDVLTGETITQVITLPPLKDSLSGENIHRADFTEIQRPGTYIISIDEKKSAPFRIGTQLYAQLKRDALQFFSLKCI